MPKFAKLVVWGMGMEFAPTWLRQVSPLLHMTTLTTWCRATVNIAHAWMRLCTGMRQLQQLSFLQMTRCVHRLSKLSYPCLAPIAVFVLSGLQSVTYLNDLCHVW